MNILLWITAVFAAYFVKGLCGFANTLVFETILSFRYDNALLTPSDLLMTLPSNVLLAVKERKYLKREICLPLMVLVLLGCLPGVLLLKNLDTRLLKIFFGIVIIGIALDLLLQKKKKVLSRPLQILLGIASGLLCGLFGIGALASAYMSRLDLDQHSFRANLCTVFLAENFFRLFLYIKTGLLTVSVLRQTLPLFPVMVLSLLLGSKAASLLPEEKIRKLVCILLIISGAVLILRNL